MVGSRLAICVCMRLMRRALYLATLLLLSANSQSQDAGVLAGFNIGHTEVEVNENFEDRSESLSASGIGFSVAYLSEPRIIVQLGATVSENFSLFGATDRYNLQHVDVSVGYWAQWDTLVFWPQVGMANWELSAKQGQLFNPGSEDTRKQSGNDFLWGASLGYAFNEEFHAGLSLKQVTTDFGDYELLHLVFTLGL